MGIIYGLIPYLCVTEPLVVAGNRFTSAYEAEWPRRDAERVKLDRLLEMFYDGRGQEMRVCTWFILRHPKAGPTEEGLITHQRLISAVQFALLDSEGRDSTLSAEQADVWLFHYVGHYDWPTGAKETHWQTAGSFRAALSVVSEHDKFYPREPMLEARHVMNMERVGDLLERLLPPAARLDRLSQERRRILDSLPFFMLGCSSGYTVDIRARLVNLVTAFEVLLNLGESKHQKRDALVARVVEWVTPVFGGWAPDDIEAVLDRLMTFCEGLYRLRNSIVHEGETRVEKMLFRGRPDEQPFIGYVWKARQIFVACVRAKLGILDPGDLALILEQLVSNQDRLSRARQAFARGDVNTAVSLIRDLRHYPTPEPVELILDVWKRLANVYVDRVAGSVDALPPEVAETLQQHSGLLYHSSVFRRAWERLRAMHPLGQIDEKTPITSTIIHFADYAGYALSLPYRLQEQRSPGG